MFPCQLGGGALDAGQIILWLFILMAFFFFTTSTEFSEKEFCIVSCFLDSY
jgi:hypothetical protein